MESNPKWIRTHDMVIDKSLNLQYPYKLEQHVPWQIKEFNSQANSNKWHDS